ncbi:g5053 [Coccomyxa viridis]|uniref:G5053 protein n=1 Tax=Coccomyxa viridis TaxID=1274662 RepID=A0ABP1FT96_9CHLO
MEESASPAGVKQKLARTDERRCISLLDLPENLIIDILRYLPTKSKCQAELVCRTFREILSNPNPADYVWDVLDVNASVLQHIPLPALHKWLLRRIQGVYVLRHFGSVGGKTAPAQEALAKRFHHIALTILPLLSGLLAPEAVVELDLRWGDTEGLFASHQLEFESQYWGSMAPVLTCLDLQVEAEKMTEGLSAALCQLSVLNTLELRSYLDAAEDFEAVVNLDLPRLEILVIADFGPTLQDVSLELPLHEGIPKILEQLPILRTLSLRHNRKRLMHLDRPLDPFLDMPTLKFLELFSCLHGGVGDGSGMCLWTPAALKLLGLADQRIMQMRLAPPGRTITLRY